MPEVHELRLAGSIEVDDLHIDLDQRLVRRGHEVLAITARSFELLRFLIDQYPRIAAPREIIAGVWPRGAVSGDALTQRVKLLRRQLGGSNERYVSTVHGIGYRLASAPLRLAERRGLAETEAVRVRSGRARWLSTHPVLSATLAAALACGVLAGAILVHDPPHALKHALKHRLGGTNQR